jgi:hypothetical protein
MEKEKKDLVAHQCDNSASKDNLCCFQIKDDHATALFGTRVVYDFKRKLE